MAAMIDDVLGIGRALDPDVVVFEAFALAGPLAAEVLGIPGVAHMFGPLPPMEAVMLANDAVSPIWRGARTGCAGLGRHLSRPHYPGLPAVLGARRGTGRRIPVPPARAAPADASAPRRSPGRVRHVRHPLQLEPRPLPNGDRGARRRADP